MTPTELLAEIEPLTHAQRVRRVVELGRRAVESDVSDTIQQLAAADDTYQRWLALLTCFTSRDGVHVLRALEDPSRLVRGLAHRLVPQACNDAQARTALDVVHPSRVGPLLRRLRRARRQTAVDAYLAERLAVGDPGVLRWLPFASADLVASHLELAQARFSAQDWRRLTRHHPSLALQAMERLRARGPGGRGARRAGV